MDKEIEIALGELELALKEQAKFNKDFEKLSYEKSRIHKRVQLALEAVNNIRFDN